MSLQSLLAQVGQYLDRIRMKGIEILPNIVGAVVLVLIGWLIARALRALASRFIGSLDRLLPSRFAREGLQLAEMKRPASELVSAVVFWTVIVFFVTAATETLGLPVVTTWLGGLSTYLPKVIGAVLIGIVGILGARLARDATTSAANSAGVTYAHVLGRVAQAAILLITVVVVVRQVGIDVSFFTGLFLVIVGTALGGAALAFGLGAKGVVSNILACHYVQKTYRVGQTVRIGALKGSITRITPTAVILENEDGEVLVPAHRFNEEISVLVSTGD